MKKYKLKNIKFNSLKLSFFGVVFVVLLVTLGYSSLSANISIGNATAIIQEQREIRISWASASGVSNGGVSSNLSYTATSLSGNISLPNNSSTVTYEISITNAGNVEMGLIDITGLPNNMEYSFSDYALGSMLCDNTDSTICSLGSVTTIHMTIGYKDGGFDSSNTTYNIALNFDFDEVNYVAKIGNTNYTSLQAAVNAAGTNAPATVVLLKSTGLQNRLEVAAGQDITLNLQRYNVSAEAAIPLIDNYGILRLSNGTLFSSENQGVINVKSGASLIVTGGLIQGAGNRQAIYNEGGYVSISGSAYLKAKALASGTNKRATVQNLGSGTLIITGGTIEVSGTNTGYAVSNIGVMTIGTNDGNVSQTIPCILGKTNGVYSETDFNFYDGLVKAKTAAFNNEELMVDTEDGYEIYHSKETSGTESYDVARLAIVKNVIFNATGGTVAEASRKIEIGHAIGDLPAVSWTDHTFDGWFTASSGGTMVTSDYLVMDNIELFAHWTENSQIFVARIVGGTEYHTLVEAVANVPTNNTETTIELLRNTAELVSVSARQNIILDMKNFVLSNTPNNPIFENSGTIKMISGTILTNSTQGAINVKTNAAIFEITGGSIVAVGNRQTIYVEKGTAKIGGNAYLVAKAEIEEGKMRGTVQSLAGSKLIITGGTIESNGAGGIAVSNSGTLTIGVKDGNISTQLPLIRGKSIGVYNASVFNFYDGIIKGESSAISGSVADIETSSTITIGSEIISGSMYETAYLE